MDHNNIPRKLINGTSVNEPIVNQLSAEQQLTLITKLTTFIEKLVDKVEKLEKEINELKRIPVASELS
jgi:hypothetical protein